MSAARAPTNGEPKVTLGHHHAELTPDVYNAAELRQHLILIRGSALRKGPMRICSAFLGYLGYTLGYMERTT